MHSRSRQSVPAVALASLQPTRSQHTMWILRLVPYLRIPIHIHDKRNDGPSSNQVAETSAAKTQSCESHSLHWEQQAKVVSTTTLWTKPYAHTTISTSGYSVEPENTQRRMSYVLLCTRWESQPPTLDHGKCDVNLHAASLELAFMQGEICELTKSNLFEECIYIDRQLRTRRTHVCLHEYMYA